MGKLGDLRSQVHLICFFSAVVFALATAGFIVSVIYASKYDKQEELWIRDEEAWEADEEDLVVVQHIGLGSAQMGSVAGVLNYGYNVSWTDAALSALLPNKISLNSDSVSWTIPVSGFYEIAGMLSVRPSAGNVTRDCTVLLDLEVTASGSQTGTMLNLQSFTKSTSSINMYTTLPFSIIQALGEGAVVYFTVGIWDSDADVSVPLKYGPGSTSIRYVGAFGV